jgi:type III secretion protein U
MSEKTEQPTPKKIRDARKKGQVPNSKDVTSTALLIVIFTYLGLSRVTILQTLMDLIVAPCQFFTQPFEDAFPDMIFVCLKVGLKVVLPLVLLVFITGVMANVLQFGLLMAPESIMPKFDKLNPISKLKQMFSMKNLIEFLKSAAKIIFLGTLLYFVIRNVLDPLLKIPYAGLNNFVNIMPSILKTFAYNVGFAYIVVAFLDFIFQRHNHTKQLMMSKDEVKREYKEMEGDPTIKGKRKQLHRELLQGGPAQKTKRASALVTNPTHYAIALYYDEITVPLPIVLAKGTGFQAQIMKKVAMDYDIPIMENVPLAHALYDLAEIGRYIPRELIEPVAEVIRWVRDQKQRSQESIEISQDQWDKIF